MHRVVPRLATVILLVLGSAAPSAPSDFRLVRSVRGPGYGRALAAAGDDVLTSASDGAHRLDGASGALLQVYTIPHRTPDDGDDEAVAVAGGLVVVGARFADEGADDSGGAYVFAADTGTLLHTLSPPEPRSGEEFGFSVAFVGSHVAVGAPKGTVTGVAVGAVHLFDAATGAFERTLVAPSAHELDAFGFAVTALGGTVAVGAPGVDDPLMPDAGAVHLFDTGTGTLVRTLRSDDPMGYAAFGSALAAAGDDLAVGAPGDVDGGTVRLLDAQTGARLRLTSGPDDRTGYGRVVQTAGSLLLVGQPGFYSCDGRYLGHAYVVDGQILLPPLRAPGYEQHFGAALAGTGTRLWIGDPSEEPVARHGGAVYLFADAATCGDGHLDPDEACDDGNTDSGEGCDANCRPTGCGNGAVTGLEQCDDGNLVDADGCDSNCTLTTCGNGIVTVRDEDAELCDDGNLIVGDGCDVCTPTACGNGFTTEGEECDDGNRIAGDGCEPDCRATPGLSTTTITTTTVLRCRVAPDSCDDHDPCTYDTCGVAGCRNKPYRDFDAVLCVLDGASLLTPACLGEAVPGEINRRLAAVHDVVEQARKAGRRKAAGRLLKRARHALRNVSRKIGLAADRGTVSSGCASEMRRVVGMAMGRANRLRRGESP